MKSERSMPKRTGRATRAVIIFAAAFVALAVAFGACIGIINAVDSASAVVHLDGVKLRRGEVNYLASRYKATYVAALRQEGVSGVFDTEAFWSSAAEDGKSYGEKFTESFREYLSGIIAANRIFYQYSNYTAKDRAAVDKAVSECLTYTAGGSVEKFNSLSAKYGFNYGDFSSAAAYLYRAERAKEMIYGKDGSSLSSFPEECEEYLSEYIRVKVIFVRRFDRLTDSGDTVDLTEAERAAKAEKIERIREYIENGRLGLDNAMSPDAFELFLRDESFSDSGESFLDTGYYLHPSAEQTAYFKEAFPEVYEVAASLEVGEFGEAEWESDVAFVYRLDNEEGAYKNDDNLMFSDFYSDLSDRLYPETLAAIGEAVVFTDLYGEISPLDIPMNTGFRISFATE